MLTATPSWLPLLVAGNIAGIAVALLLLGVWVRRLFKQHLTDPIAKLQTSVDGLSVNDIALRSELESVKALAEKAHDRIDQIVLGGHNA